MARNEGQVFKNGCPNQTMVRISPQRGQETDTFVDQKATGEALSVEPAWVGRVLFLADNLAKQAEKQRRGFTS